jgi:hypothetical protein
MLRPYCPGRLDDAAFCLKSGDARQAGSRADSGLQSKRSQAVVMTQILAIVASTLDSAKIDDSRSRAMPPDLRKSGGMALERGRREWII